MATRTTLIVLMLAVVTAAALLIGCGGSNPHALGSYDRAATFRSSGKHQEAVDAYATFLRRSPTDSLAAVAQYEKALSYMELKEFPLAVVEFQILRQEYPTSSLAEAASYHEGVAQFREVRGIERDITSAHEARETLLAFLRTYPDSEFAVPAREHLVGIADLVVRKQMRAVKLYRRLKKHESAAIVLDRLLETERRSSLLPMVLKARIEAAEALDDEAAAREFRERLRQDHPDSEEARRLGAAPTGADEGGAG